MYYTHTEDCISLATQPKNHKLQQYKGAIVKLIKGVVVARILIKLTLAFYRVQQNSEQLLEQKLNLLVHNVS